jgi:hypothetical protein
VRQRHRRGGRGVRPGPGHQLDVLQSHNVQVHRGVRVRSLGQRVLHAAVPVCAEHAGVPARGEPDVRHRGDVHGDECYVSVGQDTG